MREFKFRVWDKDKKQMFYQDKGDSRLYKINLPTQPNEPIEIYGEICAGQNNIGLFFRIKQAKLMQFTGLLDKNGKEIYEGDVIKSGVYIGKVKYEGAGFLVFYDGRCGMVNDECEVIGNIYENKEFTKMDDKETRTECCARCKYYLKSDIITRRGYCMKNHNIVVPKTNDDCICADYYDIDWGCL